MTKIQNIIKHICKYKIEYLAILVSSFTLFTIIWPIVFAVHDDIFSYIVAQKGDIFKQTIASAKGQGRFWFLVSLPICHFPFIFNNFIVYKIISYSSICFSVVSLGILLYRNVNNKIAYLAVLLFFTFAQLDGQHNLLVCYVFTHQIAIGVMLFSIDRLLNYYKSNNERDIKISAILLFIATILYESFILFSVLLFFISLLYNNYHNNRYKLIKRIIKDLRFHIIIMLLYLIIYFIWRSIYSSNYDGAQISLNNITDSLKVIFTYGLARVPLVSTLHNYKNYQLSLIEPIYVIKGFISSLTIVYIIKETKFVNKQFITYSLILSIIGIFLPVVLHSVTPRYVEWVKAGSYAYLPSFYSYFFIIAFISILLISIYQSLNNVKFKYLYLFFIFTFVLCGSLMTDINNQIESNNYQTQLKRYKAFDNAVSSEYFQNIENGAVIYVPDYNGIHNYMPYLDYYASLYSEKQHTFTKNIEELTFVNPTYGFHYDEESGFMLIGKLKDNMLVDDINVVSDKSITNATAIIYQENENIVAVDNTSFNVYDEVALVPIESSNKYVELSGNNMDLFNSNIINQTLKTKITQSLELSEGFYQQELWGSDVAYWCGNTGVIELYNTFSQEKYAIINARIASGDDKKTYQLILTGNESEQEVLINASQQDFSFKIVLHPGKNVFTFKCDAPALENSNGDSRSLVFYVINLNMKFEEE